MFVRWRFMLCTTRTPSRFSASDAFTCEMATRTRRNAGRACFCHTQMMTISTGRLANESRDNCQSLTSMNAMMPLRLSRSPMLSTTMSRNSCNW